MGFFRLHFGGGPLEHEAVGLGADVGDGGTGELLLADAGQVGEREERLEALGQGVVDRRERGGVEVAAAGALLVEEEVGEVEPCGIELDLPELVGAPSRGAKDFDDMSRF